ncbi:Alpha/Beta hydrolase protein [Lactifluus subvellereus]|nr:Alpha/Beta hydrolase protein [Lactifluus subvellereus]
MVHHYLYHDEDSGIESARLRNAAVDMEGFNAEPSFSQHVIMIVSAAIPTVVPEGTDCIDHEVLQHIRPYFSYQGSRKASTRCPGTFEPSSSRHLPVTWAWNWETHPGIFTHAVYINPDSKEDQRATFFGDVDEQVELVAQQLKDLLQLSRGFDAIGSYVSKPPEHLSRRAVHSRIRRATQRPAGSQHMGISDIPPCKPSCENVARVGVYSEWAQQNLVQAQYYRDPAQLPRYLESDCFLTSTHNKVPATRNTMYAAHFLELDALVLVLFTRVHTVGPKESWFGSYAAPEDGDGEGIDRMSPNARATALHGRLDWAAPTDMLTDLE